jgi:hypothetical protein
LGIGDWGLGPIPNYCFEKKYYVNLIDTIIEKK